MAEEINDGTSYLRALKHATSSLSGAAAAPAHEPERPTGDGLSISGNGNRIEDMSDENAIRLKQLLASLSRPCGGPALN